MHACQTTFALALASEWYAGLPMYLNHQRLLLANRFIVGAVRTPTGVTHLRAQLSTAIMVSVLERWKSYGASSTANTLSESLAGNLV